MEGGKKRRSGDIDTTEEITLRAHCDLLNGHDSTTNKGDSMVDGSPLKLKFFALSF